MQTVAIIDYNMGNLHSVHRAAEHVAPPDTRVIVTRDPDAILQAERIIFPGQGAARDCMRELHARELIPVIHEVMQKRPFLGICMGLEVLLEHSEENGGIACTGFYAGEVRYFGRVQQKNAPRLKIPQIGWNQIWHTRPHPLWEGVPDGARFYFVHSYYIDPADTGLVCGSTDYGIRYASAIARNNVFAIQAHPEKSADAGLQLLSNFMHWNP
ncbi:MAG: imidazole glycerol phosphate synthase subunit HisH [Thiothrix sp.]|nr:imidazole glycerol phosphate synthase subunit HisH [Thiothrix sp.]HPQ97071.1 imidazole glycerol phosphate synthase subunit HisH [Thiolinea sp.]